jgi:peptide/nickel transport system substrate-binding protein
MAFGLAALLLAGCTKVSTTPSSSASGSAETRQNRYTQPHVLRIGDTQGFTSLNPHLAAAISLGNLSELTMAYLVRYGADNRPIPELATEVPTQANGGISKDGLRITWHLRRGVRWSDGVPFDADDVVWTTNAVNNPANNEIGRDGWDLIAKIDEPDKYTVVYHLKKPYSGYLPTFFGSAGANPCILPRHLLARYPNINHVDYNNKPVGIGPFRYVEWVRDDHVTLEANPYYWRGMPRLRRIVYKFVPDNNTLLEQLQTGEVDMWPYVPSAYFDRIRNLPRTAYIRRASYLYGHLDFNTQRPALREPAVRQALALGVDRNELVQKIAHGVGIVQDTPESPASPWYTPQPRRAFDLAKANALLDAAGWRRGRDGIRAKNGVRLVLDWATYTGSPDTDSRIELIRANWSKLGVAIDVHHYAQSLFFALAQQGGPLFSGRFDVTLFSWQLTPDGDLNPTNACGTIPPNGENVTRLCDPILDRYLQQEKRDYDEAARRATIDKVVRRINELVPWATLAIAEDVSAYNRDLRDFHPNNTTPFDDFMNVDI